MQSGNGFLALALLVLCPAGIAFGQKFTDPNTLAPAFPTPQLVVERMLSLAEVKPGEIVYDLGCGDGRILFAAVQTFKAKAVGIEIRRDIFDKTSAHVKSLGLQDQIRVIEGDALKTDLSPADVVTLYLLTSSNERLRPMLEKYLKPTARVVSHDFEIRGWKPETVDKIMVDGRQHKIYLYRVQH